MMSEFKKEWSRIEEKVNKDDWFMTPHEVNAYYSPNFNKVKALLFFSLLLFTFFI